MRTILHLLLAAWWGSEIFLAVRTRRRQRTPSATRSGLRGIGITIAAGSAAAIAAQYAGTPRLPVSNEWILRISTALIVLGLAIRWWAILTLGRLFSVDVTLQEGHTLVSRGIYGRVRHPSYTGLLLSFLGFGISMGNWLSLALVVVPVTIAFLYRVHVEEKFLQEQFGGEFEDYRRRTKRLVPGVY